MAPKLTPQEGGRETETAPIPFPSAVVAAMREHMVKARQNKRRDQPDSIHVAEQALEQVELNFQKLVRQMKVPGTVLDIHDRPDDTPPRAA